MPKVVYVGAHDQVVLPVDGRDLIVTRGEPVELPVDVVGSAPAARLAELDAELVDAYATVDHHRIRRLLDERIDVDPGSGLLAQPENWQAAPVAKPAKPTPAPVKDGE